MSLLLSGIPFAYRALALAALALALFGYGFVKGVEHEGVKFDAYKDAQNAAVLAQVVKGATATANIRIGAEALEEVKNEKIAAITAQRNRAISELRNRPERRPDVPGNPTACVGASGADLSKPDGEFLTGEAARANTLAIQLNQCIENYNLVREKVNALKLK